MDEPSLQVILRLPFLTLNSLSKIFTSDAATENSLSNSPYTFDNVSLFIPDIPDFANSRQPTILQSETVSTLIIEPTRFEKLIPRKSQFIIE